MSRVHAKATVLVEVNHERITTVEDVRKCFTGTTSDALTKNIVTLRNHLTAKQNEPQQISPQDARLSLLQHWLEKSQGAQELFSVWEHTSSSQTALLSALVSLLSSVLDLLSSHYTFHTLGYPILKTLLSPPVTRRLNAFINGAYNELILVTLKLFNVMSKFSGGKEQRAVLEGFPWELKSLPRLLKMRRKTKTDTDADPLSKPDIRSLYILFILSFVDHNASSQTKTTFLERHRDAFVSIFKGISQDHYTLIRKILDVCWSGLWSDPKVKRTLKLGIFNESVISQLLKIYDRINSENNKQDYIPADLVHHYLLAICTRPGFGVCFSDRGWYPRSVDDDEGEPNLKKGTLYNKILANVLKSLKVNEDSRQQELALKILTACPELVAGYWSGAALTLEPRLSSKWIANIAFFGSVLSLPLPSFHLPNSTQYQPTPPPLSIILENILPSVNTKSHFSKGLLSLSALVQHCTALALVKCLVKYEKVVSLFRNIQSVLDEDDEEGQWAKRRREIEQEARRRVPEFQVVVAFAQQQKPFVKSGSSRDVHPNTRSALLFESSLRLLLMYHRCLFSMVDEARFDVGKLLPNFESEEEEDTDVISTRLRYVGQLHVLKLLKESAQFTWTGKAPSASHSYLYVLLRGYTITDIAAIRSALSSLLQHIWSASILFQEDPDEPRLWLMSLPNTRRAQGAESPDGASLTDEANSVITLLDDAIQRCLKTPYRYIEDLQSLGDSPDPVHPNFGERSEMYPSPLLVAFIEQLDAKAGNRTLTSSDLLALASYLRKLVFRLSSKLRDLCLLRKLTQKIDSALRVDRLFLQDQPVMTAAIRREVDILHRSLQCPQIPDPMEVQQPSVEICNFLAQIVKIDHPSSNSMRRITAHELVDWLRLVDQPLGVGIKKLAKLVMDIYPPAFRDIFENVDPIQSDVWEDLDIVQQFPRLREHLDFEWLFLYADERHVRNEDCRHIMTEILSNKKNSVVEYKRVLRVVFHRLSESSDSDDVVNGYLLLLASIMQRARVALSCVDCNSLKDIIFARQGFIKDSCMSSSLPGNIYKGLQRLVESSLNPNSDHDRRIVSDISQYWSSAIHSAARSGLGLENTQLENASVWLRYLEATQLFSIMDTLAGVSQMEIRNSRLLETILFAIQASSIPAADLEINLSKRIPQLLELQPVLPNYGVLEELIASGITALLPLSYDGIRFKARDFDNSNLTSVIELANMRWSRQKKLFPHQLHAHQYLYQENWTLSTVKIISAIIYTQSVSPEVFLSWIKTESCMCRDTEHLAIVMLAFLDSSRYDEPQSDLSSDAWLLYFSRFAKVVVDGTLSEDLRNIASSCISLMLTSILSSRESFVDSLVEDIKSLSSPPTMELIEIGIRCLQAPDLHAKTLALTITDHALQWATRQLSDTSTSVPQDILDTLTTLVDMSSSLTTNLVETILSVIIRHCLVNDSALRLATATVSNRLKPSTVNRQIQSILQHPHFYRLCGANAENTSLRDLIVELLHKLFNLHPENSCHATHIEPLVRIYGGSSSRSDLRILSIFQLFESLRKTSVIPLLRTWSSTPMNQSLTALDAIQSFDAAMMLRTCLHFPKWRTLDLESQSVPFDAQLHDPVFVILLFAQMLSESPPSTGFKWVELFRTNVVCLCLRAMSSPNDQIRDLALCQITALWKFLDSADFQEKPQVLYILTLLKNILPSAPTDSPKRLPSFTTVILLHALRGIFYPSNFVYPHTARFLLQRPELDTTDVPMLYGMLYSSSEDWKKDRGWMIRFLSDGMMSTEDWKILKRRHTWDLLASLFQATPNDRALRNGVLEVLANLTSNTQATASLVLKSSLLSWIEMQLRHSLTESIAWVRILQNILTIADAAKMETSTRGEWRSIICRCLCLLLHQPKMDDALKVFSLITPLILRLSLLLPTSPPDGLQNLLERGLDCLKAVETTICLPDSRVAPIRDATLSILHNARGLHEPHKLDNLICTWGSCVEMLWRASMTVEEKLTSWDSLASRLLVWRAIVGEHGNPIAEWNRTEIVRQIRRWQR